jgi:hypothetical protein
MSPRESLIGQALKKGEQTSTGSEVSPRKAGFTPKAGSKTARALERG